MRDWLDIVITITITGITTSKASVRAAPPSFDYMLILKQMASCKTVIISDSSKIEELNPSDGAKRLGPKRAICPPWDHCK